MLNSELKKDLLTEQSITYITVGILLLTYADGSTARTLTLVAGLFLCIFALLSFVVAQFIPRLVNKMLSVSTHSKIWLMIFASMGLFMGIAETIGKGHLTLRVGVVFIWICLILLWELVGIFKVVSGWVDRHACENKGLFAYKIFAAAGIGSSMLGALLVIYGFFDPSTFKSMLKLNRWVYDPMLWEAVAFLCVFPILILAPNYDEA